jgi:hypothetical protein
MVARTGVRGPVREVWRRGICLGCGRSRAGLWGWCVGCCGAAGGRRWVVGVGGLVGRR